MNQQTLQESLRADELRSNAGSANFILPSRYEENYQYPLIVWLHHDGASQQQAAEVMPYISTQNYVAVGVQATRACDAAGHHYQWLQSPLGTAVAEETVFAAIDEACRRFTIHPERIYLCGYREGGTMALRLGLRNASQIAGVVSIDGSLPRGGRPLSDLQSAKQLAIFAAVAMMGQRYPIQTVCEDLKLWHAANLRMDMRQYTVDDCMVKEVLRDINAWIMARVTGTVATSDAQECANGCSNGIESSMIVDHETTPVQFSAN
jgi:phospholipase/carboxylesterase